jgi:hypothetical protein
LEVTSPSTSRDYFPDVLESNSKCDRQLPSALARLSAGDYLADLIRRELRRRIALPLLRRNNLPTFLHGVSRVVFVSASEKVVRANALWHIAPVENKNPSGNGTHEPREAEPMGECSFAVRRDKPTVSALVLRTGP